MDSNSVFARFSSYHLPVQAVGTETGVTMYSGVA